MRLLGARIDRQHAIGKMEDQINSMSLLLGYMQGSYEYLSAELLDIYEQERARRSAKSPGTAKHAGLYLVESDEAG